MNEHQRKAEERGFRALLENPQELQKVLDTILCGIILIDPQGHVTYSNAGARRMLGLSREALIEHRLDSLRIRLLDTDERPVTAEELPSSRALHRGETVRGEVYVLENSQKERIHIVVNVIPLRDEEGRIAGAVADFIDISAAKETELTLRRAKADAEEASQAKSRFLANVSHEIRTPMTVFMGMVELTLAGELQPQERKYLETALASADSLLLLIEEILEFSELETNTLVLSLERFDLGRCVRETLAPFGEKAREKRLDLRINLAPDVPKRVTGDERRLQCVLRNLVGNALKFTQEGWVEVEIASCPDCLPGREAVLFSVRDSGIGIDSGKIDLLFRPFTQLDASSTRSFEGAGLGLAISKGLVERMGGEIRVHANPGRGSTFSFYLPIDGE